MNANITEIKRFAVHDGDGIRTTLFFKGCPLKCLWCHNPETIDPNQQLAFYEHKCTLCGKCSSVCKNHKIIDGKHILNRDNCVLCYNCVNECPNEALIIYGKQMSCDEIYTLLAEDKDFYETSGGGITLSGGECLLQPDACAEILKKCKENGINTAVDTCGFVSRSALNKVIPYTDVFLYDIKAMDEDVHIKCTGQSNKIILDNLKYLDDNGCKIEIRIPYIPDYNDSQIKKIADFFKNLTNIIKVKVLPYHTYAGSKYNALGYLNTLPPKMPTEKQIKDAELYFIK